MRVELRVGCSQLVSLVVECPRCGEEESLPPVSMSALLMTGGAGSQLTVDAAEFPRVAHVCAEVVPAKGDA